VGTAEMRPDDGVEARVPHPLERIVHPIGDGVSRGVPVRFEDRASGIVDLRDRYRLLVAHIAAPITPSPPSHPVLHHTQCSMPTCAFISFRLGLTDGVSVVADSWM